jgi:hypothetical protein
MEQTPTGIYRDLWAGHEKPGLPAKAGLDVIG